MFFFFNLESLRCSFSSYRMSVQILYAKCPKGKHKTVAIEFQLYLADYI